MVESGGNVAEGLFRGVIVHPHEAPHRCQANGDAFGTDFFGHGLHHFKQKPRTVFDASTVAITALIAGAVDELIEQVAVTCMDFHTVHTGQKRIASRLAVIGNDRFDARNIKFLGNRYITPNPLALFIQDERLARHRLRGRCHRQAAVGLKHRV